MTISEDLERQIDNTILTTSKELETLLNNRLDVMEKNLKGLAAGIPFRSDLLLRHLDIILETLKSALIVSSTMFVTVIAVDENLLPNINIDLVRIISFAGVLISSIFAVYILWKRENVLSRILKVIGSHEGLRTKLNEIRLEVVDEFAPQKVNSLKKKIKEELKGELSTSA